MIVVVVVPRVTGCMRLDLKERIRYGVALLSYVDPLSLHLVDMY